MNLIKGIIIGGSIILAFAGGMITMFYLSEHYQRIIRVWIERKYTNAYDPIYDDEPPARPRKRRPAKKEDPLEVKSDANEQA